MKVKEDYFKDIEQKELRKRDDELVLFEVTRKKDDIRYSTYILMDEKHNYAYMTISIPDPTLSDTFKNILLKYQHGVRKFMKEFFDVYIGKKTDIKPMYTTKQEKDLTYSLDETGGFSAVIYIILPDGGRYYFGDVSFMNLPDKNLKIAENFVKYFEGIPLEFSWKEICEE